MELNFRQKYRNDVYGQQGDTSKKVLRQIRQQKEHSKQVMTNKSGQ